MVSSAEVASEISSEFELQTDTLRTPPDFARGLVQKLLQHLGMPPLGNSPKIMLVGFEVEGKAKENAPRNDRVSMQVQMKFKETIRGKTESRFNLESDVEKKQAMRQLFERFPSIDYFLQVTIYRETNQAEIEIFEIYAELHHRERGSLKNASKTCDLETLYANQLLLWIANEVVSALER